MCLVGWGYWGVQRQAVEALEGGMPGVGARDREGMPREELGKLWNGRSWCLREVGDKDGGSDDALHSYGVHSQHWVSQYRSIVATVVDARP